MNQRRTDSIGDFMDKVPPQDLEAERCVLGCLMLANESMDEVAALLSTGCFYMDAHRRIYAAIKGMLGDRKTTAVDAVTLRDELTRRAELDVIGGTQYLMQLLETVPHASHAEYYAKIVREKWLQRSLIEVCTSTLKEAYHGTDDVAALLDRAESRMTAIVAFESEEVISMEEAIADTMEQLYAVIEDANAMPGVSLSHDVLSEMLVKLAQSCLYILAGRPGHGKTAFALDIMLHAARCGVPVLFISCEMNYLELTRRLLSSASSVTSRAMQRGDVRESTSLQQSIFDAAEEIRKLPIYIFDGVTGLAKIKHLSRRAKRMHGVGLVIVDYLQLIDADDKTIQREQQVSTITRGLKLLAKSMSIPILALSQLNRGVEGRDNKVPRLSDLRESGAIEQDADTVTFIHVPHHYDDQLPRGRNGKAVITIAKNRHGPLGSVELDYDETCGRYTQPLRETQTRLFHDPNF